MSAMRTVRRDDGFMLESWLKNVGTLGATKEEAGSCFFNFHSISQSVSQSLLSFPSFACMHACIPIHLPGTIGVACSDVMTDPANILKL